MSWNAHSLASGSRDRLILMRDVRAAEPFTYKLVGHKQEVTGGERGSESRLLSRAGCKGLDSLTSVFCWNRQRV